MERRTIYFVLAALFLGTLVGSLLVDRIKKCPEPELAPLQYTVDSLNEVMIMMVMEAEKAEARAINSEARIKEMQESRQPTSTRVANAKTRYYTDPDLDRIDSLLGSEPD